MRQMNTARQAKALHAPRSREQRTDRRASVSFGLMYSCVDADHCLLGDGAALNLSKGGLGIHGNQPVQVGMELVLFLYLPDQKEPLFEVAACVIWSNGYQFGVKFKNISLAEEDRLHAFLLAQFINS